MSSRAQSLGVRLEAAAEVSRLAGGASLEIGSLDFAEFAEARKLLVPGQRLFVSHLPGQTWKRTWQMCSELSVAGFEPVPHIPIRLLENATHLDEVLSGAFEAGARDLLLIAGDYVEPRGQFDSVIDVVRTNALRAHGYQRVSFAGHPEGHPRVPWDVICQAQVDKWRTASALGLEVAFVTQFFFASEPFVNWARFLRASGVQARLFAGLSGPTSLGRLIKLARHCGVGASIRSLTSRPASFMGLLGEHQPGALLLDLTAEKLRHEGLFDGLHVFSLGGFRRSAAWLRGFHPGPPG